MANPFYISRETNPLGDLTKSALGLATLKQQGEIASQDAALRSRQLGIADVANELARQKMGFEYGPDGIETRKVGAMEKENDNRAAAIAVEQNKLPASTKPFDMSNYTRIYSQMKLQGIPVENLSVLNDVKAMAENDKMNRGDVAHAFSQSWPELKQRTNEDLLGAVSKLSDKAAGLQENDPERKRIMQQIDKITAFQTRINAIPDNDVKAAFFPDIAQEEANTKAAIQEIKSTAQADMLTDKLTAAAAINDAKIAASNAINDAKLTAAKESGELRAQTAKDVAQARLEGATAVANINAHRGLTEADKRAVTSMVASAETMILTKRDKEEVSARVDEFNQMAEKPYAYTWKPGRFYGGTWEKTKLPVIKGKQVTAKDVYDTAAKHGMTFDAVLAEILKATEPKK